MKKGVLLILLLIVTAAQVTAYEFCDNGVVGEDNLRIISVDDMLKDNNQEWRWEALQNIELEIRVENGGDAAQDYTVEAIFVESDNKENIVEDSDNLEADITLSGNERKSISLEFQIEEDADVGDYELYIKFYRNGDEDEACTENSEEQIKIEKIELCEDGNVDKDDLEITKIIDNEDENDEKWNWAPGNEIEILVDVSNKEYTERDFVVELIMLDEDKNEVEFTQSGTEEEVRLDEGEDDTVEFNFELRSDISEGDYNLYAKIYDEENEDICTMLKAEEVSNYKQIKIEKEENNAIVSSVSGPEEIQANSIVQYTAKITNLGSDEEEKVLIILYNNALGLRETIVVENLESGQERDAVLSFTLPENSTLGQHKILFATEFEYDNKKDLYRGSSDSSDDIKYIINVLESVAVEAPVEEVIEEVVNETIENETIIEDIIEDVIEEEERKSAITGNVVGDSDEKSIWPITIGLLFLAVIGIFLFFKKPGKRKSDYTEQPMVTRRYTASLD